MCVCVDGLVRLEREEVQRKTGLSLAVSSGIDTGNPVHYEPLGPKFMRILAPFYDSL